MRGILTSALSLIATAVWFAASPTPASAASAGVRDDGHFFSADAIEQAGPIIQKIRSAHHKDVLVQTYAAIPENLRGDYESQGKERFFPAWAERVGRQNNVNGIVILACKEPSHLEVAIGQDTRKRAFTEGDRRELVDQILSAFKAKKYDQGLLDGLRFIQDRMDRNLGNSGGASGAAAAPGGGIGNYGTGGRTGTSGSHLGAWVCLGIGALVIGMFNRSRRIGGGYGAPPVGGYPPGSYPPGGYPPGYGASGGGFGRGLLGGLLGGALGAWGYDRLSHRGDAGQTYTPGPPPVDQGGTGVDTSYSSEGGDFGAAGSGGSGGGDFSSGGGDFGGGGGDFGGGGGDSGGGGDFGGGGGGDSGSGGDF